MKKILIAILTAVISTSYLAQAAPTPPASSDAGEAPAKPPADAYLHDGFYFRGTLGIGYESVKGSDFGFPFEGASVALTLLFGGTPIRGLVVGGGIHFAAGPEGYHGGGIFPVPGHPDQFAVARPLHTIGAAFAIGPFVDWYPDARNGWHVGAAAGLGRVLIVGDEQTYGPAGGLFGGCDFWVSPQFSMGAFAAIFITGPYQLAGFSDNRNASSMATSIGISALLH
jgi:hypothetical protein